MLELEKTRIDSPEQFYIRCNNIQKQIVLCVVNHSRTEKLFRRLSPLEGRAHKFHLTPIKIMMMQHNDDSSQQERIQLVPFVVVVVVDLYSCSFVFLSLSFHSEQLVDVPNALNSTCICLL